MSLPKQRTQAEAWRLFFVSGSLAWLRRPRLASFTSTTDVETIHPLVVATPVAARGVYRERLFAPPSSAELLRVTRGTGHVAFGVTLGQRLSLVLLLAALGEADLDLGAAVFEVELQGDDRQ